MQSIDEAIVTGVCVGRGSNGAQLTSAQGEGLHELSWAKAGMRLPEDAIMLAVSAVTKLPMPLESQTEAQEPHSSEKLLLNTHVTTVHLAEGPSSSVSRDLSSPHWDTISLKHHLLFLLPRPGSASPLPSPFYSLSL